MPFLRRIPTILATYDPEPVELAMAFASVLFGFWMVAGFWDAFLGPSWFALHQLGGPHTWGVAFLITGAMRFGAVEEDWRLVRTGAAIVGVVLWFMLGVSFFASAPTASAINPLAPMCILTGVASGWTYLRLLRARPAAEGG